MREEPRDKNLEWDVLPAADLFPSWLRLETSAEEVLADLEPYIEETADAA